MEEKIYRLWFMDLRISNNEKIWLLSNQYSPESFYNLSLKGYTNLGFNIFKAEEIQGSKNLYNYEVTNEYNIKEKINIAWYEDDEYPLCLRNIYDPPIGFFYKGKFQLNETSLAIVGSRKASEYGRTAAYQLAYELGKRGVSVISGLARGIDSCAHRGCFDGGGYTIGVMGSGFKNIYPRENISLFKDMTGSGCVVSEYFPDVPPLAFNFPKRNRIISGLSKFVLVIEAGERSGSLITANLALEQGKDVFAVPGNIYSPNSRGTNKLIKDGAKPILNIDDILEEFGISITYESKNKLDKVEAIIVNLLGNGGMSLNDILETSGLDSSILLSSISRLECSGIIKKTFGNYYIIK